MNEGGQKMCGRYYVDDETSREIEKIVKKLDQRLKIEHGQDIHPSESAVILTKAVSYTHLTLPTNSLV